MEKRASHKPKRLRNYFKNNRLVFNERVVTNTYISKLYKALCFIREQQESVSKNEMDEHSRENVESSD